MVSREGVNLKVVQVTKDNSSRDRGFIAVDAICSAFENRENGNVQIMTMDGYWYDVLDDIEKIRNAVVNQDVDVAVKESTDNQETELDTEPKSRIRDFYKKYKMPSPAISEGGGQIPIDREENRESVNPEDKKTFRKPYKRHGKYGKYGKSRIKVYTPTDDDSSIERNLPAVSGKGQNNEQPLWTDKPEFPSEHKMEGL